MLILIAVLIVVCLPNNIAYDHRSCIWRDGCHLIRNIKSIDGRIRV